MVAMTSLVTDRQAAALIGITHDKFCRWVFYGKMPRPVFSEEVGRWWRVAEIDAAIDELPDEDRTPLMMKF